MDREKLNAGDFSLWLSKIRESIRKNTLIEVPCGDCHACCKSSLFIHIKQEETQTLNVINNNLLFEAPNLSQGSYLLGYLFNGNCPMLKDDRCSIYDSRPITCKKFDCRTFAATGLKTDSHLKEQISKRVERWEFSFPKEIDKVEFEAVNNAAHFIKENKELFPEKIIPALNSGLAVLAIKVYKVFINNLPNQNTLENKKNIAGKILQELELFDNVE